MYLYFFSVCRRVQSSAERPCVLLCHPHLPGPHFSSLCPYRYPRRITLVTGFRIRCQIDVISFCGTASLNLPEVVVYQAQPGPDTATVLPRCRALSLCTTLVRIGEGTANDLQGNELACYSTSARRWPGMNPNRPWLRKRATLQVSKSARGSDEFPTPAKSSGRTTFIRTTLCNYSLYFRGRIRKTRQGPGTPQCAQVWKYTMDKRRRGERGEQNGFGRRGNRGRLFSSKQNTSTYDYLGFYLGE